MLMENRPDIRTCERRPFDGAVRISWQTSSGEMTTIKAKCLDISDHGIQVACPTPLVFRTSVYVQAPMHGLMGNATVRYCRRKGMGYIVGLMFSSAASQADEGRRRLIQKAPDVEN